MMTSRLTLTVLAMTAVLAAPQAFAQSVSAQPQSNQSAKQDRRAVTPQQQPAAAPKSAPTRAEKKPAAKPSEAASAPQQPAANPQAAKKDVPRIESNPLGRVKVDGQGSTFGFSADTKMNAYQTPDGQSIRGMDHQMTSTRQPNYFGLSLSVPTTSSSSGDAPRGIGLLPLPPLPRN